MDGGRDHPRKDGINTMTNEMKKALQSYCEKENLPLEETRIAARYLEKHRDIIPEALPAAAAEFQWTLQHNVDSYGCDYDWVYSEDGLSFILNDQFTVPEWATDTEAFKEEFPGIELAGEKESNKYDFHFNTEFLKNGRALMQKCYDEPGTLDNYIGSARTGDICFDFVVLDDRYEGDGGEVYFNLDLYVGGIDSGYGYSDRNPETPNYPYDFRDGCGGLLKDYLGLSLDELVKKLEAEMTEYLDSVTDEDTRAAINRPYHYW